MNDSLVKESPHYKQLQMADRCDRCGESSQAFVRVVKLVDGKLYELLFCGHHFNRYEPVLVACGWLVQDERNTINLKAMSGAPEGVFSASED